MSNQAQTKEEKLRKEFLDSINFYIEYWGDLDGITPKDKLRGLAMSILTTVDGMSRTNGLKHYTLSYGNTKLNADTFLHDEL